MKRPAVVFIVMLASGIVLRAVALGQLDWFFGSTLHVDEITYSLGGSPPFERPPGTYLAASISHEVGILRTVFSVVSLIPSLAFFALRKKDLRNSLVAGFLALEPTLAFSGFQVLPSAPAAALLSLSLLTGGRPVLRGWLAGCAALFRGELLLLLPVSLLFTRPVRKWFAPAGGFAAAVLPLMAVNLFSGGPFSIAGNGPLNLWLGSSTELLSTPPGIEYEELVRGSDFTGRALDSIMSSPLEWGWTGIRKTAAFISVPGPGRNLESPRLLGGTVLVFFLPVTGAFIALALAGLGRNWQSALLCTGLLSAFVFFPSMRHRAIYIPAMAMLVTAYRWKPAAVSAALVLFLSLFFRYPAGVRPGLTEVQTAQNMLEQGRFQEAEGYLERAEDRGYLGADLHTIRGACIASSGGDFTAAAEEFSRALSIAPGSPSAWKNMAALLWNYGHEEEAVLAAERAVSLNPMLREELAPILYCRN